MKKKINLKTKDNTYSINIEPNSIIKNLNKIIYKNQKIVLLIDRKVFYIFKKLKNYKNQKYLIIDCSEKLKSFDNYEKISEKIKPVLSELRSKNISVLFDKRDTHKPGFKFNEHEIKGVPIRIAIGPKDLENNTIEIFRRDKMLKENIPFEKIYEKIDFLISDIQEYIFNKAQKFTIENTRVANSYDEFKSLIKNEGGFVSAHWDGSSETEEKIKKETKATIRCIPSETASDKGFCMVTNKPSSQRVLFAKAY